MSSPETPQFEGIIGSVDGESGYLFQCLCGKQFDPWDVILSIYPDMPTVQFQSVSMGFRTGTLAKTAFGKIWNALGSWILCTRQPKMQLQSPVCSAPGALSCSI